MYDTQQERSEGKEQNKDIKCLQMCEESFWKEGGSGPGNSGFGHLVIVPIDLL